MLPLSRQIAIAAWASSLLLTPHAAHAAWTVDGNPVCTAARSQGEAHAVTDGAGGVIVAWADQRNGGWDVFAQRLNAAGDPVWTLNGLPLCVARGDQDPLQMVADGAGGAIVVWHDYRCGSAIYAQRIDASGTPMWAAAGVPVTISSAGPWDARAVTDGAGGVIVVWEDNRGGSYAQRIGGDGVTRWGDGVALGWFYSTPSLVEDGAGGVLMTYGARTIFAQHLDAVGAPLWPAGQTVCSTGADAWQAVIVGDGLGGAVVAWTDWRAGNYPHIYAQRIGPNGTPLWTSNGIALCDANGGQDSPAIAADGAHGALVAWIDHRFAESTALYARRIDAAGDTLWQTYGNPLTIDSGARTGQKLLADGSGGAIVAWQDDRHGWDVYAQRITGDGLVRWATYGVILCGAAGDQTSPEIVTDGRGGALVAWNDARVSASQSHVYAGRVDSTGRPATNVGVDGGLPAAFRVLSVAPNPAHGGVAVAFALPASAGVSADVYDLGGRRVRTLAAGRVLAAGAQRLEWDARDAAGTPVPDGLYFVRVRSAGAEGRCQVVITR